MANKFKHVVSTDVKQTKDTFFQSQAEQAQSIIQQISVNLTDFSNELHEFSAELTDAFYDLDLPAQKQVKKKNDASIKSIQSLIPKLLALKAEINNIKIRSYDTEYTQDEVQGLLSAPTDRRKGRILKVVC